MVVRGVLDEGFGDRGHYGNATRQQMSANRQAERSTLMLFLSHARLRKFGVSSADLRRGVAPGSFSWPLGAQVRLRLAPLLTEAGISERVEITVRESRSPGGFEFHRPAR